MENIPPDLNMAFANNNIDLGRKYFENWALKSSTTIEELATDAQWVEANNVFNCFYSPRDWSPYLEGSGAFYSSDTSRFIILQKKIPVSRIETSYLERFLSRNIKLEPGIEDIYLELVQAADSAGVLTPIVPNTQWPDSWVLQFDSARFTQLERFLGDPGSVKERGEIAPIAYQKRDFLLQCGVSVSISRKQRLTVEPNTWQIETQPRVEHIILARDNSKAVVVFELADLEIGLAVLTNENSSWSLLQCHLECRDCD